jgi:hypothetical protein
LSVGTPSEDHERLSFYLLVAGGVVGLIRLSHPVEFGAAYEMFNEAKNLAERGGFANPFFIANTGFTAVNPPLYPLALAIMMKLLTVPSLVTLAAATGNIVTNAIIAACLPRISFVFYEDVLPGVLAGMLWLAVAQLMPAWDTNYTLAGLILFCLFSARSIGRTHVAAQSGAAAGVAVGLLFLLNPSSALVSLPWIAYLLVRRKVSFIRAAGYGGVLLASLVLVVSPWALRNRHQLGALVLRTNLGMTLYASNNDCAESSLMENLRSGCYETHHPNLSMSEARLLRALGEVEYDRRRTADAESWVMANPARFRRLTAKRVREFWFPPPDPHPYTAHVVWLATVLAIPGLILMIQRREPVTVFVVAVQLIYPLMYYLVVTDMRYRYPVIWLSLLPAGYFIRAISPIRPEVFAMPPRIMKIHIAPEDVASEDRLTHSKRLSTRLLSIVSRRRHRTSGSGATEA